MYVHLNWPWHLQQLSHTCMDKCCHGFKAGKPIIAFCVHYLNCSNVPEWFLSSQSHKLFESELSQSHLNFLSRVRASHDLVESESSHKNSRVTSSHWFASSSQGWVEWNLSFFLRLSDAMKWHPTEMITIRFAGWIFGRIVSLQPHTDIQKLLSNGERIRIRISETLLLIFRGFRFLEKVAH